MRSGQSFLVCKRPRPSPRAPGKWQVAPLVAGTVPAQEPSSPTTHPGPLSALTLLARPPANTALPLGCESPRWAAPSARRGQSGPPHSGHGSPRLFPQGGESLGLPTAPQPCLSPGFLFPSRAGRGTWMICRGSGKLRPRGRLTAVFYRSITLSSRALAQERDGAQQNADRTERRARRGNGKVSRRRRAPASPPGPGDGRLRKIIPSPSR